MDESININDNIILIKEPQAVAKLENKKDWNDM
jgi:hypothetical protein